MQPVLGRMADVLGRVGLAAPAFRLFQRLQSLAPSHADPALPPAFLRILTTGAVNPIAYVEVGERAAREFVSLAEQNGRPLTPKTKVLDFGCGCGRVARALQALAPVELHGCDVNARLIAWCVAHLKGTFQRTRSKPPLPYPERAFDLVYALSVFTHLTERRAVTWLQELARVTRPGGLAILSFLDAPDSQRAAGGLQADGFAIKRSGPEGSNLLTVYYTPEGFAERAVPSWRMRGDVPSERSAQGQALIGLERV